MTKSYCINSLFLIWMDLHVTCIQFYLLLIYAHHSSAMILYFFWTLFWVRCWVGSVFSSFGKKKKSLSAIGDLMISRWEVFFLLPQPSSTSCSIWTHAPTHTQTHTLTLTPLVRKLDLQPIWLYLRLSIHGWGIWQWWFICARQLKITGNKYPRWDTRASISTRTRVGSLSARSADWPSTSWFSQVRRLIRPAWYHLV